MIALRALYPKLSVGGYLIVDDYGALECCRAAVHDFRSDFSIAEEIRSIDWAGVFWRVDRAIPPISDPLKSEQLAIAGRTTNVEYEPALHALLTLYDRRSDLRAAFPEAAHWDFRRLVDWGRRAENGEYGDGDSGLMTPYRDWLRLNSVDLSRPGSVPWPALESTTRASANPLPHTLSQVKSGRYTDISEHLITLAFLVREFNLKRIVEVGTREGRSTVALLEAARMIDGDVLSIDIEPCQAAHDLVQSLGMTEHWRFRQANALSLTAAEIPHPIDLLFIDTFHLFSQTLSELRKFVPLLHPGSWIALHDSVTFPGVSQALLEVVQSLHVKPRFYSFVNQNGLSLLRI
jgi:predicted O-methyltransferase YrrM